MGKPQKKSVSIALGTHNGTGSNGAPGGGPTLRKFAESVDARTVEDFSTRRGEFLCEKIPRLLDEADEIHFKLDNMTSLGDTLQKVILVNDRPSSWTAFEFRTIWQSPALLDKTTFYVHVD